MVWWRRSLQLNLFRWPKGKGGGGSWNVREKKNFISGFKWL